GDDIRTHGSGNAGATNALRTYGKMAAVFVTLGDCLKAVIACVLARLIARYTPLGADNTALAIYCAGFGAVLGHNFPLYFKFKGGKGILVSVTALLFAHWQIALAVIVISIAIMAITKYVSLGSVIGSILFIVFAFIFELDNTAYVIFTTVLALLAIYKHRANIVRLIKGTESKLTDKKQ
ncbi:MAG: glycerol-3-phosphate 1-O-acyltransferase PlsY, partial [Clostridia bacterium]|nr:glycerol-3-phosphate 1-O-acyltransferase PlsY [Clostridia bacterium]